jgi:hypothetical protein
VTVGFIGAIRVILQAKVFRCNAAERGKAGTPVALGKTSALTALGNSAYRVVTAMQ